MPSAPLPLNEDERLAALKRYEILDTDGEVAFDDLTLLASHICDVPISLVSLVDDDRQWFKSHHGINISETPREGAFCSHAILQPEQMLIIPDTTKDRRFADSSLVTGDSNVRFYAGAPLVTDDGFALGTLCVLDTQPRELTGQQLNALSALRRQVLAQLELHRNLVELQQKNLDLLHLNQEKNDFLGMAAHDLKNPIGAIMGYAEDLRESYPELSGAEILEEVGKIHQLSQRMFGLVTNLLDVNAIEEQQQLHLQPLQLRPLLQHIICDYQSRAAIKEIHLQLDVAVDGDVSGHPEAAHQVLDNLISNAIKYSPLKGQVDIRVLESNMHWAVAIADRGQGMSEHDQKRLFQKFAKLSARPTGGEHSTGLGLFIVKKLVDAMQATIECKSVLGQGTTFTVSFLKAQPQ